MNFMKKLLVIAVLFLGLISVAEAQRGSGERPSKTENGQRPGRMNPEERINKQTAELKEKLALSEEQTAKVKAVLTKSMEEQRAEFEKRREEMEKAREEGQQMDREKMHAEMLARMEKQDKQIEALLTPEQKTKYQEMVKERKERMKERRMGPPSGE
jgi:Spy/CpxP family protein refolding chaperone